ncbi:MAG: hypothetical protein Kow00129_13990 [Thermoleophilia bacterium]
MGTLLLEEFPSHEMPQAAVIRCVEVVEGRWTPLPRQVGGRAKVEPAGVHYAAWGRSVKYASSGVRPSSEECGRSLL